MKDNKTKIGKQDRIRVSAAEPYEVEYLHSKFPMLLHQQVISAIRAAGPLRKDIVAYIKNKYEV